MTGRADSKTSCRPFTLLDGMILVAGVGAGFAWLRARLPEYQDELDGMLGSRSRWSDIAFNAAGILLILGSMLVLILRLRKPRPKMRQVARQPGFGACFTAVAIAIGCFYSELTYSMFYRAEYPAISGAWHFESFNPRDETAYAIAAIWLLFALGRIGRREPGWIDRSGRVLGWCWIAWGVGNRFLMFYFE